VAPHTVPGNPTDYPAAFRFQPFDRRPTGADACLSMSAATAEELHRGNAADGRPACKPISFPTLLVSGLVATVSCWWARWSNA
jgi:hypothetical protein